jgi:hypothetical protein
VVRLGLRPDAGAGARRAAAARRRAACVASRVAILHVFFRTDLAVHHLQPQSQLHPHAAAAESYPTGSHIKMRPLDTVMRIEDLWDETSILYAVRVLIRKSMIIAYVRL